MKVGDASNEIRKDVIETEAQQKLLRGALKQEFESLRREMKNDFKKSQEDSKPKESKK